MAWRVRASTADGGAPSDAAAGPLDRRRSVGDGQHRSTHRAQHGRIMR